MKRKALYLAIASVIFSSPAVLAQDDNLQSARSAPGGDITEIVTLGEYIPDEKRATAAISNVLDAEALVEREMVMWPRGSNEFPV